MSSLVQGFFTDVHVSFLGYIPQCGMAGSWKYVYVELFGNAKLSSSGGVVISHCGFDLCFSKADPHWASLPVLTCHLLGLLGGSVGAKFCPLLNESSSYC